jgi:hypothetical protein
MGSCCADGEGGGGERAGDWSTDGGGDGGEGGGGEGCEGEGEGVEGEDDGGEDFWEGGDDSEQEKPREERPGDKNQGKTSKAPYDGTGGGAAADQSTAGVAVEATRTETRAFVHEDLSFNEEEGESEIGESVDELGNPKRQDLESEIGEPVDELGNPMKQETLKSLDIDGDDEEGELPDVEAAADAGGGMGGGPGDMGGGLGGGGMNDMMSGLIATAVASTVATAASRGWKVGAARHRYREKFGSWPAFTDLERRYYPRPSVTS